MKDQKKTKKQLIEELAELRQRVAELEEAETEHKRVEEELRELDQVFEALTTNVSIIITRVDENGIYTHSRGSGLEKWGLEENQLVGLNIFEAYPQIAAKIERVLKGREEQFTYEGTYEGEPLYFQNYFFPDRVSGKGMIAIAIDITERKRAEEALRRSEKQASAAIEAARGFTFSYDIATGKITWGGAIEEITGYTPEEFAQVDVEDWEERIHPEDREEVLSILQEAIETLDRATAEYRFRKKDGSYVTLASISITERENGKAVRLVGVFHSDFDHLQYRIE